MPIRGPRLSRWLTNYDPNGKWDICTLCHLDAAVDWGGIEITNASGPQALKLRNCSAKNMAHMGSRNGLNPKIGWILDRQRYTYHRCRSSKIVKSVQVS